MAASGRRKLGAPGAGSEVVRQRAGRLLVGMVAVVGCLAGTAVPATAGCMGQQADPIGAVIAGAGPGVEAFRLVIIGRVTKVHRAVRDDHWGVVTPVEVSVEAVLRGAAGAVVRFRNPGGTLPDGSGVGVGTGWRFSAASGTWSRRGPSPTAASRPGAAG